MLCQWCRKHQNTQHPLSLCNGYSWVSTVVCNHTLGLNGLHGGSEEWFSSPQLQLMVITPGIFLGCRTQVPVLPSGWKNDSVVWKAETSGSLRKVAFSSCIVTINMCICAMYSYTSRTWYLHLRAQRRCFGKAAPVVLASSYHDLCSSSTRRCGAHQTGALTETWAVLMKSRRGCTRISVYRRICFIHL